jgi:hypothetical protein
VPVLPLLDGGPLCVDDGFLLALVLADVDGTLRAEDERGEECGDAQHAGGADRCQVDGAERDAQPDTDDELGPRAHVTERPVRLDRTIVRRRVGIHLLPDSQFHRHGLRVARSSRSETS